MIARDLVSTLRASLADELPLPGAGQTALRHKCLLEIGRNNLSLARLSEAHWDAVAILAEAQRRPVPNVIYGVWASEREGQALKLHTKGAQLCISGAKLFCSGAGLVDRALVTVLEPEPLLFDVDLRSHSQAISFDHSIWKTQAFAETRTAAAVFQELPVFAEDQVGSPGFYLNRPGFWHGACGPAACWAGGAVSLVEYAMRQKREDPHTFAHLAAMHSAAWALRCYLDAAGREIDAAPSDAQSGRVRARTVRHLIEQACTDILRRLTRAYGPYPLAMDEQISLRYQELDIYLRQSHAERDLESLGKDLKGLSFPG